MSQKVNPEVFSANELNDPLQAILSNTEMALLVLSSSNPDIDKIKAALGDVVSEVTRVTQMIRAVQTPSWRLKKGALSPPSALKA